MSVNLNACDSENVVVSVIVPVYNVESYLSECVESVRNQTHRLLEIILVDDGSTDNSGNLCDKYLEKDDRIKVIHKLNGGLSSARNVGIQNASGEFIAFIDSDDWIENTMIQRLLTSCLESGSLLSMCGSYVAFSKENIKVRKCPSKTECLSLKEFWSKLLRTTEGDFISCDKLYHRSLWENYKFPEGKIYEDIRVLYKVIEQTNLISAVAEPLYYYRIRSTAITATFNPQAMELADVGAEIREYIDAKYPDLAKLSLGFYIKEVCDVITIIENQNKEIRDKYKKEQKLLKQILKRYFLNICLSNDIPAIIKIKTILILTDLLKIINKIREKKNDT